MNEIQVKSLCNNIFSCYDKEKKGYISRNDASLMMRDAYSGIEKEVSTSEINEYLITLDYNGDGKVTYGDIESLVRNFFNFEGSPTKRALTQNNSEQKKYSQMPFPSKARDYEMRNKLEIARNLFKKFDKDGSGFIEEDEVYDLIRQTYLNMGIYYNPTYSDVRSWISMMDKNFDNRISLNEFEEMLIKSLEDSGIKF